ncbi:MAG: hypothetical protein KAY59_04495 [Acidobacteria bacterium]|nr:hypothetical protein [Acidobacteriota bacterium]
MTAGESLRASLSNSDSVYNSYKSMLGSSNCHKSGNGWEGVYYCTFPDNEFPDDPYTQGTYFGDLMWSACNDDAEGRRQEFIQQNGTYSYCTEAVVGFAAGVQSPEAWSSCSVSAWSWCEW